QHVNTGVLEFLVPFWFRNVTPLASHDAVQPHSVHRATETLTPSNCAGQKKASQVIKGSSAPEWDEVIEYELGSKNSPSPSDTVDLVVKDYEKIGRNSDVSKSTDRLLGKASLKLSEIWGHPPSPNPKQIDLTLLDKNASPVGSYLKVEISCTVPAAMQTTGPTQLVAISNTCDGTLSAAAGSAATAEGTASMQQQNEAYPNVFGNGMVSAARRQLPDKETKFQVRVKVIEARQLNAGSAASVNPVVQLKLLNQVETTSVSKATLNPWFDEEFYFYPSKRPMELFQENIIFEVSNAKKFRSDSIIGCFLVG
ncbi:unnamed protein product, partial [Notodromas monacha]